MDGRIINPVGIIIMIDKEINRELGPNQTRQSLDTGAFGKIDAYKIMVICASRKS